MTRYRKIKPNAGVIKVYFYLPTGSLMSEDRVLQVSEQLQVPSANYGLEQFPFVCITHSLKIEKLLFEGVAKA